MTVKKTLLTLAAIVSITVFAHSQNVADYFPVSTGNSWTYKNSTGRMTNIITIVGNMPDPNNGRNTLYLFEDRMIADDKNMGTTSTLYSIQNNEVLILAFKNVLNQYRENRQPFPVELTLAGQEWRQNESSKEYYLFKTTKTSVKYDDKIFDDCILVEERVFLDGSLYQTNRRYFARDIGFVYKTV
jgi:hypothetical protein